MGAALAGGHGLVSPKNGQGGLTWGRGGWGKGCEKWTSTLNIYIFYPSPLPVHVGLHWFFSTASLLDMLK